MWEVRSTALLLLLIAKNIPCVGGKERSTVVVVGGVVDSEKYSLCGG